MIFSINCYMFSYLPLLPCRHECVGRMFFFFFSFSQKMNRLQISAQSNRTNSSIIIIVFRVYLNEVNYAIQTIYNFKPHRLFSSLLLFAMWLAAIVVLFQCVCVFLFFPMFTMIIPCVCLHVFSRFLPHGISVNNASVFKMSQPCVCVWERKIGLRCSSTPYYCCGTLFLCRLSPFSSSTFLPCAFM